MMGPSKGDLVEGATSMLQDELLVSEPACIEWLAETS